MRESRRAFFIASPNERDTMSGPYGSAWQRAREGHLRNSPLCAMCAQIGRTVEATVVDHIVPHRGDMGLFWQSSNWQSLCKRCHDGHKQRAEKSGRAVGCGIDGQPVDSKHHWKVGAGKKSSP